MKGSKNMNGDPAQAIQQCHSTEPQTATALEPEILIDVLVVDDDQAFLEEIVAYLRAQGLRVTGTGNAQDAIAIMVTRKPTLTLMDISLPNLTGVRALEIVLALDYRQDVVLMTAAQDAYIQAQKFGVGALDIVKKPLSGKTLGAILKASSEFGKRRAMIGI